MDVLNTTGGGVHIVGITGLVVFLALGLLSAWILGESITKGDRVGILIGLFSAIWFAILFITALGHREPIRHEVTLRPGHVIDATKYEVVEQRGKIYVIEEREAGE